MSPTMLATLRRVERDTRLLAAGARVFDCDDIARYPRDYYRAAELVWRWRGPGRFLVI